MYVVDNVQRERYKRSGDAIPIVQKQIPKRLCMWLQGAQTTDSKQGDPAAVPMVNRQSCWTSISHRLKNEGTNTDAKENSKEYSQGRWRYELLQRDQIY